MPEKGAYFFLSYARGDDLASVGQFYDDLCNAVRRRSGERGEVGFLDQEEIEPGDRWPDRISAALAQSATFVALVSPMYFNSEYCGKETAVFWDRLDRHHEIFRERPAAYIPVLWSPCQEMPQKIQDIQYDHRELDEIYRRYGVRFMVRSAAQNVFVYETLLYRLADRIVQAAIGPQRLIAQRRAPDITTVAPMFPPAPNAEWPQRSQYVHFVLAAATDDEMRESGRSLVYYGPTVEDWTPYHQEFDTTLLQLSERLIRPGDRSNGPSVPVDRVPELLEWASHHNQIVVLLVDTFAEHLPHNRAAIEFYDRADSPGSAVLIPGSHRDPEYTENADRLEARMVAVFPRRRGNRAMFAMGLKTFNEYKTTLRTMVTTASNRIAASGPINPGIPRQPGSRPPGFQTP